ncbi:MAG: hypothetical protein Q4D26_00815 [Clostridia bacterium]|nr:hypothetical protein [Clostridia bacterium]
MINSDDVALRLKSLGYTVSDEDADSIDYCINESEEYICNFCNIKHIPLELYNTAVDMSCGSFLKIKNSMNELENYNLGGAIESITEGDISISYTNGISRDVLFEELIKRLSNKDSQLIGFRKIKW